MQKKSPRHLARSLAIQGLYAVKINQCSIDEIESFLQLVNQGVYEKANYELMHQLIVKTISGFSDYIERYIPYMTRDVKDINLVEQIILAIAAAELLNSLSVPATVIINEAVELTKLYGAEESYKFVNGLVDRLAHDVRKSEMSVVKLSAKKSIKPIKQ